jgi:hypothetical protein
LATLEIQHFTIYLLMVAVVVFKLLVSMVEMAALGVVHYIKHTELVMAYIQEVHIKVSLDRDTMVTFLLGAVEVVALVALVPDMMVVLA